MTDSPYTKQYAQKYKAGEILPVSPISPEEHNDGWYLNWAQFGWGRHCAGETLVSPEGVVSGGEMSIASSRQYGLGIQPSTIYRRQLDVKLSKQNKELPESTKMADSDEESFLNISWKNLRIWPVFRERIIDRIMERSYKPGVVAMDTGSRDKKQLAYLKDRLAADPKFKQFAQGIGVPPSNVSEGVDEMTQEDVDVLNALGGYRTAAEIELEEAIVNSFEFSQYDPVLRRQIIEDLVDNGIGCVHVCGDDLQTIEYLDPARLVAGNSSYSDCRDLDICGFTRSLSISALRAESGFDEPTLYEIASANSSNYGNSKYAPPSANGYAVREAFQSSFTSSSFDMFKVEVFTFYFVGLDVERYIAGIGKMGGKIFDKVKRDSVLNDRNVNAGKRVVDTQRQYIFKVSWVIGTNFVYNTGKSEITARDGIAGQMRALMPITIYKINGPSVTQSVTSIVDDLQIAVLRSRAMMTKLPPPPGIAVDVSAMQESFRVGDLNMTPEVSMELYAISGYYLWASTAEFSMPGEGMKSESPFKEMPNNFFQHIQTIQSVISDNLNMLRLISGMNEITDGSGNPNRVQNGIASAYEQSSNRALNMLYVANESFTKQLILNIGKRYQSAVAKGKIESSRVIPMSSMVKTITLLPEYSLLDFQFYVRQVESAEFRQQLLATVGQNRQESKINEADFLIISGLINEGRVELARFYLVRAIQKKEARDAEMAMQNLQAQSQAQGEAAAATEAAKGEWDVKVADRKLEQIKLKADLDLRNADKAHLNAKELLTMTDAKEDKKEGEKNDVD